MNKKNSMTVILSVVAFLISFIIMFTLTKGLFSSNNATSGFGQLNPEDEMAYAQTVTQELNTAVETYRTLQKQDPVIFADFASLDQHNPSSKPTYSFFGTKNYFTQPDASTDFENKILTMTFKGSGKSAVYYLNGTSVSADLKGLE